MYTNFHTFFVLSNINTLHTKLDPDRRFLQTVETINSIRVTVPSAKIVFCDNSSTPLTGAQESILSSNVDTYLTYKNNLFTDYTNKVGKNKGINELFVWEYMLEEAQRAGFIGSRIFKISGRYQLQNTFDINYYATPAVYNKYVFTTTDWIYNDGAGEYIKTFFNTALWSMCSSLVDNYRTLLRSMFYYMMNTGENLEMAHNHHIPRDRLIIVSKVHGQGYMAGGEWTHF